jgi:hypothetical protein
MRVARGSSWLLLTLLLSIFAPVVRAEDRAEAIDLTEEQFKTYHDYLEALQDPRVEKMKPADRVTKIAHNFHLSPAKLKEAIEKGERYGDLKAIATASEEAIRESLKGTPIEGRLIYLQVDTREAHVVTYVAWKLGKPEALEQEACWVAVRTRKAAPISADLRLWASEPGKDRDNPANRIFDGMISGEAAARIQEQRIADFASTRYIKLFERLRENGKAIRVAADADAGAQPAD